MENKVFCFGYSRKSPDDNVNTETSINNQNNLIKITCHNKNWKLVSIEEDKNVSGSREDRKINIQIERAEEHKKDNPKDEVYILVKDSKRFGRKNSFFEKVWKRLEKNGIKIFSISKNDFLNYSNIGDRIIGAVDEQAIFDGKNYAKLTTQLKISQKLPSIPAPFGYKYGKDKNWIIDKKASKIVLDVIEKYTQSVSYKQIIKENKITKTKYYRIIKNANKGLYSGNITYYSKENGKIEYNGTYPKIIDMELFNKRA